MCFVSLYIVIAHSLYQHSIVLFDLKSQNRVKLHFNNNNNNLQLMNHQEHFNIYFQVFGAYESVNLFFKRYKFWSVGLYCVLLFLYFFFRWYALSVVLNVRFKQLVVTSYELCSKCCLLYAIFRIFYVPFTEKLNFMQINKCYSVDST